MIKFAKIQDNTVVNIVVGDNSFSEQGYVKVTDLTRDAHIGSSYNAELNKFIDIQPWDSWTLNEETHEWVSPSGPSPSDGIYMWNEEELSWIKLS